MKKFLVEAKRRTRIIKKDVMALYFACKRKDVPWYAKIIPVMVVGYALSPIDLIPDFIPVLGYLDDLIIVPLGISVAVRLIPSDIMEECRAQAEDAMNYGKHKNWFAAAVIILLWLILAIWLISTMTDTYLHI